MTPCRSTSVSTSAPTTRSGPALQQDVDVHAVDDDAVNASRGGAVRRRPACESGRIHEHISIEKPRAVVAAALVLAGCGGGAGDAPGYTQESIKAGFVKPADLGKDVIAFEDDRRGRPHHLHARGQRADVPVRAARRRRAGRDDRRRPAAGRQRDRPLHRRPEQPAARTPAGRHPGRGRLRERPARRRRDEAGQRGGVEVPGLVHDPRRAAPDRRLLHPQQPPARAARLEGVLPAARAHRRRPTSTPTPTTTW